jgi:hypothetical protein
MHIRHLFYISKRFMIYNKEMKLTLSGKLIVIKFVQFHSLYSFDLF